MTLCALLTCCSTRAYSPASPALASSSAPHTLTGRGSSTITDLLAGNHIFFNFGNGSAVALGDNDLVEAISGSHAISVRSLPPGLQPGTVSAVSATRTGHIVVAVASHDGIAVFATSGARWTHDELRPSWPFAVPPGAPNIIINQTSGDVVSLIAQIGMGMSTAAHQAFVSTDDARSFTALPAIYGFTWTEASFDSKTDGLAIAGPRRTTIERTRDGGKTWADATLPRSTINGVITSYSNITRDGASVSVLAVTQNDSDYSESVRLDRSQDGGSNFAASGRPISFPPSDGYPSFVSSTMGDTTLIASTPDPRLYISTDRGGHWTSMTPHGLPASVSGVALLDKNVAVALMNNTNCRDHKNCATETAVYATDDGGHDWTRV